MVANNGERDRSRLRCRSFVHKQGSQLVSGTAQGMFFSLSLSLFNLVFNWIIFEPWCQRLRVSSGGSIMSCFHPVLMSSPSAHLPSCCLWWDTEQNAIWYLVQLFLHSYPKPERHPALREAGKWYWQNSKTSAQVVQGSEWYPCKNLEWPYMELRNDAGCGHGLLLGAAFMNFYRQSQQAKPSIFLFSTRFDTLTVLFAFSSTCCLVSKE